MRMPKFALTSIAIVGCAFGQSLPPLADSRKPLLDLSFPRQPATRKSGLDLTFPPPI